MPVFLFANVNIYGQNVWILSAIKLFMTQIVNDNKANFVDDRFFSRSV